MNSKLSNPRRAASLVLLLLGSVGVNAEPASSETAVAAPQEDTREQAETAHREAVTDALVRISAATRLELDVELPARFSTPASGD